MCSGGCVDAGVQASTGAVCIDYVQLQFLQWAGGHVTVGLQADEKMLERLQALAPEAELPATLLAALQQAGVVQQLLPLNDPSEIAKLSIGLGVGSFPSLDALQPYYGEGVALYFAWMRHMRVWLTAPAALGLATFCLNRFSGVALRSI